MRRRTLLRIALPLLLWLGWVKLPSTSDPAEKLFAYGRVLLHLLGALPKPRVANYGYRQPVQPREANGSVPEVQGFVASDMFRSEFLYGNPVVFRGGAQRNFGFEIDCLEKGGRRQEGVPVLDGLKRELGDSLFRVFRDQYNDTSVEWMTITKFERFTKMAQRNKSKPMPYARAFPQNTMKNCALVPSDLLKRYHSLSGEAMQNLLPEPDTSLVFLSLAEGTNTKMHMDIGDTLFTQVYGRKKFILAHRKYFSQLNSYADGMNLVYMAGYDVHREPVPDDIDLREVILHPGDVLYFPPMTFHAVYNLDPITIGVSNPAMDVWGGLAQHWLLALGTLLNPWTIIEAARLYLDTGAFTCTELYFQRFEKDEREAKEAAVAAAAESGEL